MSGACARCGRFTCALCVDAAPKYAKQECGDCLRRRDEQLGRTAPTESAMVMIGMVIVAFFAVVTANAQRLRAHADPVVAIAAAVVFGVAVTALVLGLMRRAATIPAAAAAMALSIASGGVDGNWGPFDWIRLMVGGVGAIMVLASRRLREWYGR